MQFKYKVEMRNKTRWYVAVCIMLRRQALIFMMLESKDDELELHFRSKSRVKYRYLSRIYRKFSLFWKRK